MKLYCKAYPIGDLRRFSGWASAVTQPAEHELADDEYVYLWDDFTVVANPVLADSVIFAQVTPEWQDYCSTTLKFEVPDDLALAQSESEPA